jgi:hypothetical protein
MKSFNAGLEADTVVKIFEKIVVGMSKPDFDEETGIAQRAGISDVVFKDHCFSKDMSFDCVYGHVKIEIRMFRFKVELKPSLIEEKLDTEGRAAFSCAVSDDFNDIDYDNMLSVLNKMGEEDPITFKINGMIGADTYRTVINAWDDSFTTSHRDLTDLLVNIIGKQLGFITPTEANILNDAYCLGNEPVHREHYTQLLIPHFDTLFTVLKDNGHDAENEFDFNDMDNFLHYIESEDENVCGVVLQTQNNMFFFAKNMETGVLKLWNTILLRDRDESDVFDKVEDGVFDGAKYLSPMLFSMFGERYEYPCELKGSAYRKLPSTLIEAFDEYNAHLIYSSDEGFYPVQGHKAQRAFDEIDWAVEVLGDEYEIEPSIINQSAIDYKSPTYVIRKLTSDSFATDRVSALVRLFTVMSGDYHWDGEGFVDGSNYIVNLDENEYENKVVKINRECFLFGKSCIIFNLPQNITPEWLEVAREFIGYYKEWIDNHADKTSSEFLEAKSRLDELVTI